jgi:hypothetical protein
MPYQQPQFVRAQRRLALATAILASSACISHVSHEAEASERSYRAVRFDSTVSIVVIQRAMQDGSRKVLTGVTEIGGAVEGVRGDTLVMRPSLISILESGRVVIINSQSKTGRDELPDLALVPVRLAIHQERGSSWKRMAPFAAACLIGVLLAWYAFRHGAW